MVERERGLRVKETSGFYKHVVQTWHTVCVGDCNDNSDFLLLSCVIVMFHVTLQLFSPKGEVYFPISSFEFGLVCIFLGPRECGRSSSVSILGLYFKRLCMFLPALLSLCHHHTHTKITHTHTHKHIKSLKGLEFCKLHP